MTKDNQGSKHLPAHSTQKKLGYTSEPAYLTEHNGVNPPLAGANKRFVQTFVDHGLRPETAILVRDILAQGGLVDSKTKDRLDALTEAHLAFPYHLYPLNKEETAKLMGASLMLTANSQATAQAISFNVEHNGFTEAGIFSCEFTIPQYIKAITFTGDNTEKLLSDVSIKLTAKEQGGDVLISYECLGVNIQNGELLEEVDKALGDSGSIYQPGITPGERQARLQKKLNERSFSTQSLKTNIADTHTDVMLTCRTEAIGRIMLIDQQTKAALSPEALQTQYGSLQPFVADLKQAGWSAQALYQADPSLQPKDLSLDYLSEEERAKSMQLYGITDLICIYDVMTLLRTGFTAEILQQTNHYTKEDISWAEAEIWIESLPALGFLMTEMLPTKPATQQTMQQTDKPETNNNDPFDFLGVFASSLSTYETETEEEAKTNIPSQTSTGNIRPKTRSTSRDRSPSPATVQRAAALFAAFMSFLQRVIDMIAKTEPSQVAKPCTVMQDSPQTPPRSKQSSQFGSDSSAMHTPCRTTTRQTTLSPTARPLVF